MKKFLALLAIGMCLAMTACQPPQLPTASARAATLTYADYGSQSVSNLLANFYSNGKWKKCLSGCPTTNTDWGADSLTYTLFLRWKINNHDASVVPYLQALSQTSPSWSSPCKTLSNCNQPWSDQPLWDSIALGREYEATGLNNASILSKEKAAFNVVDGAPSSFYLFGACPSIRYQQPGSGSDKLKTLETDSNYIKAALLLYHYTKQSTYLTKAKNEYSAVRHYFLDSKLPLYTTYLFDNGKSCSQDSGRFYASVNGNMIFNGWELANYTGNQTYLSDANATAQALASKLSDTNGVYADLQAENDIAAPLIEGMYDLATSANQSFARNWLLTNASASASTLKSDGTYGRFFDGPIQVGTSTAWQTNGGYALAIAADGINPGGIPATTTTWTNATSYPTSITTASLPQTITFTGTGIALIGTLGEVCCQSGHARVAIDGTDTTDRTGIWQNKSSSGLSIPDTILFAWRWPTPGTHTITIEPGFTNAKEGGSFVHIQSYLVTP